MKKTICGVQQMGIGVTDVKTAWNWYRKHFGMDINVFEDHSPAEMMLPHTDGKPREKHAALAMNMEGGGGFEIWQHKGFEPQAPTFDVRLGDYGIYITKMKCRDVQKAYQTHKDRGLNLKGKLNIAPNGLPHYYIEDPYGNIFEVVQEAVNYKNQKSLTGGVYGGVIGVSDIDKALKVYADILEYDEVVFDKTDVFEDFKALPGGDRKFRRILLKHSKPRTGPFSPLMGPSQIELVQLIEDSGRKIYENRIWGELGYIHMCFDVVGMDLLKNEVESKGFPFTTDSADGFEMGETAGRFAYIEDPDGTLIEFVEAHKLPIIKKLGWNMKLKGRDPKKSLPRWMINSLALSRIKD